MKKIFLSIIMYCVYILCLATPSDWCEQLYYPEYPSSPEAASLGKYGAYPVDYNTGLPIIQIPLYDFKAGGISLPICLNYHASGIKVDDIASSVGLGWSLNAGGCISVQVNGRPDFQISDDVIDNYLIPAITFEQYTNDSNSISSAWVTDLAPNIIHGERNGFDAEHDIYNYNINGYVGQFIIDNGEIRFLKNSDDVNINFNQSQKSFTLIDKYGIQYHLENREVTTIEDYITEMRITSSPKSVFAGPISTSNVHNGITAWMLSYIVSPNMLDTIHYEYKCVEEQYNTRIRGHIQTYTSECQSENVRSFYSRFSNTGSWIGIYNTQTFTMQKVQHKRYVLQKIVHNRTQNQIVFSTSVRNDLKGSEKIDRILVLHNQAQVYQWDLNYSYFITNQNNGCNYDDSEYELKRLKLSSIHQVTIGEYIPLYSFEYYNENEQRLACRNCPNGYDHYGYFNELLTTNDDYSALKSFPRTDRFSANSTYAVSWDTLTFPYVSIAPTSLFLFNLSDNEERELLNNMGDRTPNELYVQALSLRTIHFPTGGKTTFYYEKHTSNSAACTTNNNIMVSGLRIGKIVSETSTDSIVKTYNYGSGVFLDITNPNYFDMIYNSYNNYFPVRPQGCMNFQNYPDVASISFGAWVTYNYVEEHISSRFSDTKKEITYTPVCSSIYNDDKEAIGVIGRDPFRQSVLSYINYGEQVQPFSKKLLEGAYKYGLISSIKYYDNNTLLKEEFFDYQYNNVERVFSNIVRRYDYERYGCYSYNTEESNFYYIDIYYLQTGKSLLRQKITKHYSNGNANPIIEKSNYEYDGQTELVRSITDTIGTSVVKKEFTYPYHYTFDPTHVLSTMTRYNMIGYPIEQKTKINGQVVDNIVQTYSIQSGHIVPTLSYTLNTTNPVADFNAITSTGVSSQLREHMAVLYNAHGNITEQFDYNTGVPTCYLWSYRWQYPVIKITGVYYADVLSALGSSYIESLSDDSTLSTSTINALHARLLQLFPTAQVEAYTYKPLVGITSQIDSRGISTFYSYDGFGRLKEVYQTRSGVKEVLKAYDYNYAD